MWIWIRSEISLLHGVVGKGFGKSQRKSMVCVRNVVCTGSTIWRHGIDRGMRLLVVWLLTHLPLSASIPTLQNPPHSILFFGSPTPHPKILPHLLLPFTAILSSHRASKISWYSIATSRNWFGRCACGVSRLEIRDGTGGGRKGEGSIGVATESWC